MAFVQRNKIDNAAWNGTDVWAESMPDSMLNTASTMRRNHAFPNGQRHVFPVLRPCRKQARTQWKASRAPPKLFKRIL